MDNGFAHWIQAGIIGSRSDRRCRAAEILEPSSIWYVVYGMTESHLQPKLDASPLSTGAVWVEFAEGKHLCGSQMLQYKDRVAQE